MSDVALMHAQNVVVTIEEKGRGGTGDLVGEVNGAANVGNGGVRRFHLAEELHSVSGGVETDCLDTDEYDLILARFAPQVW